MTIDFGPYFSTPGIGVFRGCSCLRQSQAVAGSRRQSQRSRQVSAGLVSPTTCFSWPSSSQTNNQSYLPLPSWFSYLSLPSLFSWPFLHTLPKQTTKQTIKETNKHTNKKQTHKQVLQDVPRNSQVLPEIPDTSR